MRRRSTVTCTALKRCFTLGSKPDDGVPLVPGSRLQTIHGRIRGTLSQGVVFHCSKALTLLSCLSSDWVTVRFVLITSSLMTACFHFMFPDPRPMRMFYGILFAIGHGLALGFYLLERSEWWSFECEEDVQVFDHFLKPSGFTRYQARQILRYATYMDYSADAEVCRQGEPLTHIFLVVEGTLHFHRRATETDRANFGSREAFEAHLARSSEIRGSSLTTGMWVGEIFDKGYDWTKEHAWVSGCVTDSPSRLLRFEKRPVHDLFASSHAFESAALAMQVSDLWKTRRVTAAANSSVQAQLLERVRQLETEVTTFTQREKKRWW
jgi:CRP-like cAMP-binding protein